MKLIDLEDCYNLADKGEGNCYEDIQKQMEHLKEVSYTLSYHSFKRKLLKAFENCPVKDIKLNIRLFRVSSYEINDEWHYSIEKDGVLYKDLEKNAESLINSLNTHFVDLIKPNFTKVGLLGNEENHQVLMSNEMSDELDDLFLNDNLKSNYRNVILDNTLKQETPENKQKKMKV